MVNKCAVPGCKTGYTSDQNKGTPTFHFPLKNVELNKRWVRFVNRESWHPTKHSVICLLHFEDIYVKHGKRKSLKWNINPVPTVYPKLLMQHPSSLPTVSTSRPPPGQRILQADQYQSFLDKDNIQSLDDLSEAYAPSGFQFKRFEDEVLFFNMTFDDEHFPSILETIKIDRELHVQLQYNGMPLPLPRWFVHGHNARLTKLSMLENLPAYIKNTAIDNHNSILEELKERSFYHPLGRPPFSAELLRYALHLRYTSLQAYTQILERFPMPSISLLRKIQQGGIDSVKALKLLRENNRISFDCIMMVDEMYLQKSTSYSGGSYVGADEDGNLYKGIVAFMIVGLKESIPYIIQAVPEVTFTGKWLAEKMTENMKSLIEAGFCVRGIVTDNHAANVNAFSSLVKKHNSESNLFINHPQNHGKRTFLFYDSVHLMKNIRNNLLNRKKFVFPGFSYDDGSHLKLDCPAGYITWGDLHKVHDKDANLKGSLRKAPKLTYQALHPGSNKQSVPLAISIVHDTTITAIESYFPERKDVSQFLKIFNTWWKISNSKQRFSSDVISNAIVAGDNKTDFYKSLASWIDNWRESPAFTLTTQTASAFTFTLRSQAMLIDELLGDGYQYVLTGRLQSDPIERRFSQYRQMSGGRFLVSLREITNSERILSCRSLIKEDFNFWEEDLRPIELQSFHIINEMLQNRIDEINECTLDDHSAEVATTVAGYIARKLQDRSKCGVCKMLLTGSTNDLEHDAYLSQLSRGGLFVPSKKLADFVCHCFAILDLIEKDILSVSTNVTNSATSSLKLYGPICDFTCENHRDWGFQFATKIVTNVFFNNKQKLAQDSVRQEQLIGFKSRQRSK